MPGLTGNAQDATRSQRWNPVTVGLLGGVAFGVLVIHSTAAAAMAFDNGTSVGREIANSYSPSQVYFISYHAGIGAVGGLLFGVVFRARLAHETRALDLERKFMQAQKLEGIGRLAAGVAHDMNNFLSALQMRLHVAAIKAEDCPKALDQIQQGRAITKKASALPRQLLAVSRRQPTQPRLISPQRITEEALPLLGRTLGERIRVTSRLDDVGLVRMDPVELEQCLLNLLVNARDAMPGGGQITVTLRRIEGKGSDAQVRLSVSDTGTGIPNEVRPHIFEAFYTTKPEGQGTGLGLSTCMEIVQRAGGSLEFETATGRGTTFHITLPSAGEGREQVAEDAFINAGDAGHGTILVVEDQADVLAGVQSTLQAHGYQVLTATNGLEAVQAAQASARLDLVLSDVVLPGLDGPAALERIRGHHPGLPAILVSSFPQDQVPAKTRFLGKPLDPDRLLVAVHEAIAEAEPDRRRHLVLRLRP